MMSTPNSLRSVEMRLIEDIFDMRSGYVLDFSNRTFADFFTEEIGVDIDEPRFSADGASKAKRLRCFLRQTDAATSAKALRALWDYREAIRRRSGSEERMPAAAAEFAQLLRRLEGRLQTSGTGVVTSEPVLNVDLDRSRALRDRLMEVSCLGPQPRGYAYERFLRELFDAHGLSGRASFRLIGEQIDGSFELGGATYLLEAKWQGLQVGAADLRSFNAKVEDKSAWARGLFVSDSGFTEEGLTAFGRGKSLVCMDGLDLYEMLDRGLSFSEVMTKKVRRAAETGSPFIRVRELFP
jgi:hypothetical protein